jgi:hypothetical protein
VDPGNAELNTQVAPVDPNAAQEVTDTGDEVFLGQIVAKYADFIQKGNFPENVWEQVANDQVSQGELDDQKIESSVRRNRNAVFAAVVENELLKRSGAMVRAKRLLDSE